MLRRDAHYGRGSRTIGAEEAAETAFDRERRQLPPALGQRFELETDAGQVAPATAAPPPTPSPLDRLNAEALVAVMSPVRDDGATQGRWA